MKRITTLGSIALTLTMALSAVVIASPKGERANKYFTVAGTVLQIDKKERTLLVRDRSQKLYQIGIPEGSTFKITQGRYSQMREPALEDVMVRDRVQIRCNRSDAEHLARLEDGSTVTRLTAAR